MAKLKIKGEEKEVEIYKNSICDFCEKRKDIFVGCNLQTHTVRVPKYKCISIAVLKVKYYKTDEYYEDSQTFEAGICKDCAIQLSKLTIK